MANNKPIDTLRDGGLKATVWKNTTQKGDFYNVKLSQLYRDQDGNYKDGESFNSIELLRVAHLTKKTYDRISELRKQDRDAHASSEATPNDGRVS